MKTEEDVHAICKPKESKVNKDQFKLNAKRKKFAKRDDRHENIFKCKYCGKSHASKQCPAFGKKCYNCGKNNHFSKVCQKKKVFGVEENKTNEHLEPLFIGGVNHPSSNNGKTDDEYFKTLRMQDKEIRFKIDISSQANILPAEVFKSSKEVQLKATNAKLTSYAGKITGIGTMPVEI